MQALVLIVVVVVLLALCLALSYNRFARQRQLLLDAWSGVDTELRRRHDLVPNLTAVVKGYAAHERGTFESVAAARALTAERAAPVATPTVGSAGAASAPGEAELGSSLRSLLAVAEAYPELKADQQFLDLQRQLVVTEDRIQAARRLYNGNVRSYNQRVDTFPSLLVARLFHFERAHYFQLDPVTSGSPEAAPSLQGARSEADVPDVSGSA
jgi:LemA protein